MLKRSTARFAACIALSTMCAGISVAASRTCSDPQVKEALAVKAQNSRNNYVDMLNRQGRNIWVKVTGVHEIESLSTDKASERKNASLRPQ